ncbi:MAG: hypothetical protein R3E10_10360 [Gemmatimonadota bacterium]
MSTHLKRRARRFHREWILPALGGAGAGVLFGLTVIFLMKPVVDAGNGELLGASFLFAVTRLRLRRRARSGRLATLQGARKMRGYWKALALVLATPGFLACTDPVALAEPETAIASEPRLADTIHPCRVGGGDRGGIDDRLAIEWIGRC